MPLSAILCPKSVRSEHLRYCIGWLVADRFYFMSCTGTGIIASYWLDIIYPAPIGQLLPVALEHASVCLINATATGTEILTTLVLSDTCFFPYSPPIGWTIFYPCSHWSITAGCPEARQRVPNQRHGHRYGDT